MQNILGRNLLCAFLLIWNCTVCVPAFAIDKDSIVSSVTDAVESFSESAKPLFNPDQFKEKPGSPDPFFDKIKSKRAQFMSKQKQKQRDFFDKIRKKGWQGDKLQEELNSFQQKQKEEMDKFLAKQQKKIDQHMAKK